MELGFLALLGFVYVALGTTKFRVASPEEARPDSAGQRELKWYPQNPNPSTSTRTAQRRTLVRTSPQN